MDTSTLEADPVLDEIVRRLVDAMRPERIYLFGSRARGDHREDSDYDLLVVLRSSDLPPHKRDQAAYRHLKGVGAAKDVLVWTADEFDARTSVVTSLPATVLREGRQVYAA